MTERIDSTFSALRSKDRSALIPFIMAGDPDLETTGELLKVLPGAGADLIEIGMPFSDPVADGPTIQAAGQRALQTQTTLENIFKTVKEFREQNTTTPIILMGYYNPIYRYGIDTFCRHAKDAGIDGMIIVDLPPEEEGEFIPFAQHENLCLIKLITPTSDHTRLKTILKTASGFVYYVAVAGITGDTSASYESIQTAISNIKNQTDLPIAVGFGIKTPDDAKTIGQYADGVVVGSALIQKMTESNNPIQSAKDFITHLASALS